MEKEEVRELFDKYGEIFARQQEKDMNRHWLSEVIQAMMGEVKGKKILDTGCGAGFDSKIMAKKGAEVVGVDISPKMIKLAKKKCKGLDIRFYIKDMVNTGFRGESFDLVTSIITIGWNRSLKKVLKEYYRLLKKGGQLILADVHPIRKMVVYTGNYFETGKHWEVSNGWERFGYYRKIEDILNTAIEVGFTLKEIREPKPKGVKHKFYPYFLVLKFEK
jgi:ubiquinone/menaquinone biosynthesis C-methylase UbiE